jgi:hypothetical protein
MYVCASCAIIGGWLWHHCCAAGAGDDAFGRQLFMISPKLLPDLVHTKSIRTSIVFNGKDIASSEKG